MTQWHIDHNGTQHGPFTSSQLRKFATQVRITPATPIRRETDSEWFAASRVKSLFLAQQPVSPQADDQPEPDEVFAAVEYVGTSNDRTTVDSIAEHLYSDPESPSDVSPFSLITPSRNESPQQPIPDVPLPHLAIVGSDETVKRTGGLSIMCRTAGGVLLTSTLLMLIVIAHEQWAQQKFERQVHESALLRQNFRKSLNDQIGGGFVRPLNEYIAEEKAEPNKFSWFNR